MTISKWTVILIAAAFTVWCSVYFLFPDAYVTLNFAPKYPAMGLYLAGGLLALGLRDPLLRLFASLWLVWPVFGTLFSIGHYYERKLWAPLSLDEANIVFLSGVVAMILGMRIYSFFFPINNRPNVIVPGSLANMLPLLLFPIIYCLSLLATGSTLLTGTSIVDEIYEVNRGPIYGFRIAIVLAFAYVAASSRFLPQKLKWTIPIFVVLVLFISLLDGKRDIALLGIIVFLFSYVAFNPRSNATKYVAVVAITILAYGFIGYLRSGREFDATSWSTLMTVAGVEYRDFAHSIQYWSVEYIRSIGYNFFLSSLATIVNSSILEAVGLDKNALILMDSARTWQRAFQADVGIRIGLIGELHYALWGHAEIAMMIFGVVVSHVRRLMSNANSELMFMYLTTALAALALSIFSQASAMFGYILTFVYVAAALWLWRFFLRAIRSKPKHDGFKKTVAHVRM